MSKEAALNARPKVFDHEWLDTHRIEPHEMWDVVRETGAIQWMKLVRTMRPDGSVDIEQTVRNLGVELCYEETSFGAKGTVEGLSAPFELPTKITINTLHTSAQPLTFGHEIGHIFLTSVLGHEPTHGGKSPRTELFCDYFGYEFIMPSSEIEWVNDVDEELIEGLMRVHNLDLPAVLIRLMLAGKLPEKVAVDSRLYESPNPQFSGRICRAYMCLNCERDEPCDRYGDSIRILKFLDKEYWGGIGVCMGGEPDYFHDRVRLDTLNELYGWVNQVDRNLGGSP